MSKALIFMVVIGTAIGLAWPGDEPAAAPLASGTSRETTLVREGNGHFYTHAQVNGQLVRFVVALTVEDAMRLGIPVNPASFEVVAEGASGLIRGQNVTLDSVEIDGKRVENVRASVLEGSRLSLLGQSYLSRMGEVQMKGDYMVLK